MVVDAVWVVLLLAPAAMEVAARRWGPVSMAPSRVVATVGAKAPGMIVLVLVWGFVGWHLFARYTIPR